MVRCVTLVGDYRLCYTVSINQDHLLQVSCGSILDDHQESIDIWLVLAPDPSAMKSQYLEDPYFGCGIQDNNGVYELFGECSQRSITLKDQRILRTPFFLRIQNSRE